MSSIDAASKLIRSAKKMIVMSGFLISGEGIVDSIIKRAEGPDVRSYIITTTSEEVRAEQGGFDRSELGRYHSSIEKLYMHSLIRTSDDYCINAIVVDPYENPRGMLFPAALTEKSLEDDGELAVRLDGAEAAELAEILKWVFWERTTHERIWHRGPSQCDALGTVPEPRTTGVLRSSPGIQSLEDGLRELLAGSPGSVVASSRRWSPGHPAVQRLGELAADHTDVTVLAGPGRDGGSAGLLEDSRVKVVNLEGLGVEAVFTDTSGIVMSSPFGPGSGRGMGVGISVEGKRGADLRSVLDGWASGQRRGSGQG